MKRVPIHWQQIERTEPMPPPPVAYTVSGLAKEIGISRQTVWKMCATGQVKKIAYGLIPRASVEQFFARQMKRA